LRTSASVPIAATPSSPFCNPPGEAPATPGTTVATAAVINATNP
jgi:hypothetical protein